MLVANIELLVITMYNRHKLGKFGEDYACEYLKKNNYEIVERNFYCRQGEIDIVAKDCSKKEIVFVEVKTRTSTSYGFPSDAVDLNKKTHLKSCIEFYIYKNKLQNFFVRVDVIEVFVEKDVKINHFKQIF